MKNKCNCGGNKGVIPTTPKPRRPKPRRVS